MDNRAPIEYHLRELAIAQSDRDANRVLPAVPAGCRRLLDVGCGIGQTLVALRLAENVEAFGVDIDENAIEYGQRMFPHLKLSVAPGEQLPFADGFFDFLICRVSLPYMHVPTALAEFSRVLRDGGTLWTSIHPPAMLRADLGQALRDRNVKSVIYRSYAAVNSLTLLAGRQFPFPFNRARMESYQLPAIFRHALRRAAFERASLTTSGPATMVVATRAQRA